ncbi:EcoAI/FtnUII family type I restriction enzme subunit R [Thiohalophilus sp.]|uniref:EcoAI/FtnUII family type I restriction enzme subunit R n=1 Tax=Thiohalophilus sp. TaxID=3028392 RepID=UPI002ACDE4F9|nr:DEAD/DEAH box helicase family protein [Thiohalophilus sp.]MDZ7662999.1 DEAD/DEAH box helicase family protein [Thiohalophilus sp.]
MDKLNKKELSERDICSKCITPALFKAGWDADTQIREEVALTDGKILVRGQKHKRGERKFADYILFYKPNIPIAVIEAKDNHHSIGDGMQQALHYSDMLGRADAQESLPFVFSSNGDGFLFHDRTITDRAVEREIPMDDFPSPEELWQRYCAWKGIEESRKPIVEQDYFYDNSGKSPRYYQLNAINRTIEAIAKGQQRILLVMATGTGKTYTAFQIIWRLWKSGAKKRILYLADRNILIDQTRTNDFKPFGNALTKIQNRQAEKSYEIYLSLYQAVSGNEEEKNIYKQFSPDFFDLVVVDECHRGSAREASAWHEILDYFSSATHIGMTATPKETEDVSNIHYFGEPVYTYTLKQGIEDGFLAPYKVVRLDLDKDVFGWRPPKGMKDKYGNEIEDRIYNQKDMDKFLVIESRTQIIAQKITEYLKATDRFSKTIVFCENIDHAERMRRALVNENADMVAENRKYIMRITGDEQEGKAELDNFIDPEITYPVIATTSKLMSTGVDAQTCKLIVLDQTINSMTEFKQIVGRGTRINEAYGKYYFTIMDFKKATDNFADPDFDGEPVQIYIPRADDTVVPPDEVDHEGDLPTEYVLPEDRDFEPTQSTEGRITYVVDNVPVQVISERVQYMDANGRLITESLKDYTKKAVNKEYASLDQFLKTWTDIGQKKIIIEELEKHGVFFEALEDEIGKDYDAFDLICHVAYDQRPLTRHERAQNVRKRDYFTKYGEQARVVLDALLEKYADSGIENIEDLSVLNVPPISQYGTPVEIVKLFGGKDKYLTAIQELEQQIYNAA